MHFIKEPFDTFESKYNKDHREEMYKAQQDIIADVEKLGKIAAKAADASHKKSHTIFALRKQLD